MSGFQPSGGGGGGGGGGGASANFGFFRSGQVNFRALGTHQLILPVPIASGKIFVPQWAGAVCDGLTGVVGSPPDISWGIVGNTAKYAPAQTLLGMDAVNDYYSVVSLVSENGADDTDTLAAEITQVAMGPSVFTGYIFIAGYLLP